MMIVLAYHERRAAHALHHCVWCLTGIARNEQYADMRVADGGTVVTTRHHLKCLNLANRYSAFHGVDADEPIDWGDILAWAAEEGPA